MLQKMSKNKGITLVALILTVILLVILSAVGISVVYNSRIIEFAINGTMKYGQEGINENKVLEGTESLIESAINNYDITQTIRNGVIGSVTTPVIMGTSEFVVNKISSGNITMYDNSLSMSNISLNKVNPYNGQTAVSNANKTFADQMSLEDANRYNQFWNQVEQGLTLEQFFKFTNSNQEALEDQMHDEAEKRVKYRLMLEEITTLEKIEVTEEEASKEAEELASKYQMPTEEFLKHFGGIEMIQYDLEMRKAIDKLKELNK